MGGARQLHPAFVRLPMFEYVLVDGDMEVNEFVDLGHDLTPEEHDAFAREWIYAYESMRGLPITVDLERIE